MTVSRQAPNPDAPVGRRAARRQRTHQAIVEAARRLQRGGVDPTVAQAAEEAGVPRATAYRYFPSQDALRLELAVTQDVLAADELAARPVTPEEVPERAEELLTSFLAHVLDQEVVYRSILRTYLDHSLATGANPRPGRRAQWLTQVLEPVRAELGPARYERLKAALSLVTGVEAAIVLRDVCELDADRAVDVAGWAARALIEAALREPR